MEMNLSINVGNKLYAFKDHGPVPERPVSANPGLNFFSIFGVYLPMYY